MNNFILSKWLILNENELEGENFSTNEKTMSKNINLKENIIFISKKC